MKKGAIFQKKFWKKGIAFILTGAMTFGMIDVPGLGARTTVEAATQYNYATALQKSLIFYELQKTGKLDDGAEFNRNNWRGDSCLNDGKDNGVDLTGGLYDAGDNAKFNLPLSYTSNMLAWSYLEDTKSYQESGQEKYLLHTLKWIDDYLIKCHAEKNVYYYQVGNGQDDHNFWGSVEVVEARMERPSYKVDNTPENGGSAVCGESAAALAAAGVVFKDKDSAYAEKCIKHAKELYQMAEDAKSDKGYIQAKGFYDSWSGFYDELSFAGYWIYRATGDKTYLEKAVEYAKLFGKEGQDGKEVKYSYVHCWDDVHFGASLLLLECDDVKEEDKKVYRTTIENNMKFWLGELKGKGADQITYTDGGLAWLSQWGSVRYATTAAFIATVYSRWDGADKELAEKCWKFAKQQADYALGSSGQSYQIGYGENYPKNPHHRTADGAWGDSVQKDPIESRHLLVGAVVGGPNKADDSSYEDDRNNYYTNEVACDYNAGFTGLVAAMYAKQGYTQPEKIDPEAGAYDYPTEQDPELYIEASINAQDNKNAINFVEIKAVVYNKTAWPARITDKLTYRCYVDISDAIKNGAKPEDFEITSNYQMYEGTKLSGLKPFDEEKGIYYVEADLSGAKIYPGGQNYYRNELQFRIKAPGKWDYSNSPSLKGLKTGNQDISLAKYITLYDDGVQVFGTDPNGVEPEKQPGKIDRPSSAPSMVSKPSAVSKPSTVTTPSITEEPSESKEIAVTGVKAEPSELTLEEGESGNITAIVSPENATNKKVSFEVKDENIASVSENGTVKGLKKGNTTVTVTTEDGKKTAECKVTVEKTEDPNSEPDPDPEPNLPEEPSDGESDQPSQPEGEQKTGDDWLHTKGSDVLDKNGTVVRLTGVNWFGYNCSEKVLHGLWSADLREVLKECADRGINLMRIPVSTELLLEWKAGITQKAGNFGNTKDYSFNPDLCNEDGTSMNNLQVFDKMMEFCKEYGIKVMVDIHSPEANNSGHNYPLWYNEEKNISTQDWIDGWTWLVDRYKNDDTLIACDLKNEPHGKRDEEKFAKWDDSKDLNNWKYAAEQCANAILKINPNMLIVVEGIEQNPVEGHTYEEEAQKDVNSNYLNYEGAWWGGNLRLVKTHPMKLEKEEWNQQVMYSPHDYGPKVYKQAWFEKDFTEQTLLDDYWYRAWAYLVEENISPLLIGEWGGLMDGTDEDGIKNLKWMKLIAQYMNKKNISHTFWCLNPNSGDTNGLLDNQWQKWDEEKYALLKTTLWQTKDGKFISLDHEKALGKNGISLRQYSGSGAPSDNPKKDYVKASKITLDSDTVTIQAGEEAKLKATVSPEDATDKKVFWTSANRKIATVENGVIKGIAAGTVKITAWSGSKENPVKTVCTVTVTKNAKPSATKPSATKPSETEKPSATKPSDVTKPSETEKPSATKPSETKPSETEKPSVTKPSATKPSETEKPSVTKPSATKPSETEKPSVTKPSATKPSETEKPSVTKPSATKPSETEKPSVTKPSATKPSNPSKPDTSKPDQPKQPTGIHFVQSYLKLQKGNTGILKYQIEPADVSTEVTWSVEDSSVVKVKNDGTVTALSAGTTIVTVTTQNNKSDSCVVTVEEKKDDSSSILVKGIVITSGSNPKLKVGDPDYQMQASIIPENATNKNVTWSSSDASVAYVDPKTGLVKALKKGVALISVATEDGGKSDSCLVTVSDDNDSPTDITLEKLQFKDSIINANVGDTQYLELQFTPENTTNKNVIWSNSNPDVVSIKDGYITALKPGTAYISAKSAQTGITCTCIVNVAGEIPGKVSKIKPIVKSKKVNLGKKVKVSVSVLPENAANKKVEFISKNKKIVAVASQNKNKGTATLVAKKPGVTYITVRSLENKKATTKITITVKPAKVTGLKVYALKSNSVGLKWKAQKSVKGYQVYRYDKKKKKYTLYKTVKGNKLTISKLKKKTPYMFKVRAYVKSGSKVISGDYSAVIKAKTK